MKLPINEIICGDCVEVLADFPENSIDEVVTDPPYGIGFMGKNWDKALPSKEAFEQIFRVLKPGALAFVMSSPRQDVLWRMLSMLEGCGFMLHQSFVSWIYKSGFPKAYDVSKGIDKKFKKQRKTVGEKPAGWHKNNLINDDGWKGEKDERVVSITEPQCELAKKWDGWKSITGLKPALECILMVNKPMSEKTIVDNVLVHGVGAVNVDACRIPFNGKQPSGSGDRTNCNLGNMYNTGWKGNDGNITPQKGRFPANLLVSDGALDNGKITKSTGGTNPTGQTIGGKGIYHGGDFREFFNYGDVGGQSRYFSLDAWAKQYGIEFSEEDNKVLGNLWNRFFDAHMEDGVCMVDVGYFWDCMRETLKVVRPDLVGLAALLFDVAKASKSERNMGLGKLPTKEMYFIDGGKIPIDDKGKERERFKTQTKNFHPTVKPVKLMAYLVELGCPEGGVVLDPFCGSGSTLIAAHKLNRKWIGIEIDKQYIKITNHRLAAFPQKLDSFLNVIKQMDESK